MLLRNIGLQGIDPYKSGIPIIDNPLTFQFLPYGDIYYLPDCMFNYRQIGGQHLPPPQRLTRMIS